MELRERGTGIQTCLFHGDHGSSHNEQDLLQEFQKHEIASKDVPDHSYQAYDLH